MNVNLTKRTNKKMIIVLALALSLLLPIFSFAAAPSGNAPTAHIRLVVNGTELLTDQEPIVDGNRVLVPIRGIFELMGATVSWDPHTNTSTIQKGNTTVLLKANSDAASIDGKKYKLDVSPKLQNGRLLVPVRFISEHLGMKVNWDQEKKIVVIDDEQNGQSLPDKAGVSEYTFHLPHYVTSFDSPMLLYQGILYYCGQDQNVVQCYSAPLKEPQSSTLVLKTDVLAPSAPDPSGNEFNPDFFEKNNQVFFHYRLEGSMASSDKYFVIDENGIALPLLLQHSNAVIKPYGDSKYVYLTSAFGDSSLYLRSLKDSEHRIGDPDYNYMGNMAISGDSLFVTGFQKGDDRNKPASSLWQINLMTNQIHQVAQNCSDVLGVYGNDIYFLSHDKKLQKIASFDSNPILTTPVTLPVKLAQMTDTSLYFVDSTGALNVLDPKVGTQKSIMKPSSGEITKIETNGNSAAVSYSGMPDCTLAVFDGSGEKRFVTNQPVAYDTFDQDHVVYSVQNSNLIHAVSLH